MQSTLNSAPGAPLPTVRLQFKLEARLPAFLSNLGVLLWPARPLPISSSPGEYWADALVHRPVAWTRMRLSVLVHVLVLVAVFSANLWWLNQPRVLPEDANRTTEVLHYPLSEYLPQVGPTPEPATRRQAQPADPEHSPQKIVSLDPGHNSTRQTIMQPDAKLLKQDALLPNLVSPSPILGPAPLSRHSQIDLPLDAPQAVPPPQQALEASAGRLVFPDAPPQVVAPSSPVASRSALPMAAMTMNSPIVAAPAPEAVARNAGRLQLPAQVPPQVAPPAAAITSRRGRSAALSTAQPVVVPPSQRVAVREHGSVMSQLLVLNAHPPSVTVKPPPGRRNGEFSAGPEGRAGASGNPQTTAANRPAANSPQVYVAAPPRQSGIGSGSVSASRRSVARPVEGGASSDRIENQIFGGRRRYQIRLNMPNLSSALGSWTIRYAELKTEGPSAQGEISSPEPVRKVDPIYPAGLLHDRVEGVVVLHAIIRSDGSVSEVSVLEGFNDQLDANARTAFEQWRFQPGTRNGVPVDVEAVIRVPFRVREKSF